MPVVIEKLVAVDRTMPLSQTIVPYDGLDHRPGAAILLFEPFDAGLTIGRSVDGLLAGRDLHMDMLREGGRRADARRCENRDR